MMNLDEIRAEMGVIEAAVQAETDGGAPVTDEQLSRYDELAAMEQRAVKVAAVAATAETRSKPVVPKGLGYVTGVKEDDTLDRAFDHYLATGIPNADLLELRAQGEASGAAGGFTVPDGFRNKVVEAMVSFGGLAPNVETIFTDTGNNLAWLTNDDTANSGDITPESDPIASGADLVFGKNELSAYKYTSAGAGSNLPLRVSVELLQDSAIDLRSFISRKLGMRIARKQAVDWVLGSGVSEPLGLVSSTLTADRDLDTPDTIDYEDLVDTQDLLDEAYEGNAKWIMRKNTWSQIRLIVDNNGRPIVQDSTDGISERPVRRLLGAPVVIDEAMPALSSAADGFCIAYGDLREAYVIRRVRNLVVNVDPYSRMSNGEVEYSAWERADGTIQNRAAFVILQNNT